MRVASCLASFLLFSLSGVAAAFAQEIPVNVTPPSISGTPKPGQTLTASPGEWAGEPTQFVYRWERCRKSNGTCAQLGLESSGSQTYIVAPADALETLRVQVRAVNAAGSSQPASSVPIEVGLAWEFIPGPARIEAAPWYPATLTASRRPDPGSSNRHQAQRAATPGSVDQAESLERQPARLLEISISSGYCLGEPPPVVDHVDVIERPPVAGRPYKSAVITAFVRFPAPTEVVGTINREEPGPACAGLGYGLRRKVKLKRPVKGLLLFDGSRSPARRVPRR